jgi:hypothetical protein
MRYYKIYRPGATETWDYTFATSVRQLRNLPEGTEVYAAITDRSGHECDSWRLPVVNGRAQTLKRGVRRPKLNFGYKPK